MIPAQFQYEAPSSLADAIALLKANHDAKILSGGMSLIPLMKFRLAQPAMIVDINNIDGLDYIRQDDGWLKVGALTRESALEDSDTVRDDYPLLLDTTLSVADPIVRNRATLAGNLAHADPANDHPAAMLAYRAQVVATGQGGTRTILIDDFFQGLFATALAPDEILTEVQIPAPGERSGGAYEKMERKVGDFATAGVAVQLSLDAAGNIEQIGIGLTNVGIQAIRAKRSEELLRGKAPTAENIEAAAKLAAEDSDPNADLRGSVAYKRNLVRVLTGRAIHRAVARAKG